ncbi:hypothetical protein D6C89_07571, partial [Aureobasidium pullulans]
IFRDRNLPFRSSISRYGWTRKLQLRLAKPTHGFFSLVSHGVSLNLQRQVLGCAETFFDMPIEDKIAVSMAKSIGMSNRGYEVLRGQTLQPDALPNLKEIGAEVAAEDSRAGKFLYGPNMWPSSLEKSDF